MKKIKTIIFILALFAIPVWWAGAYDSIRIAYVVIGWGFLGYNLPEFKHMIKGNTVRFFTNHPVVNVDNDTRILYAVLFASAGFVLGRLIIEIVRSIF